MKKLLKYIKSLKPTEKDGLIEIIPIERELTILAHAPLYSHGSREIKCYYNDCYVVSINGTIRATLRSIENPAANCVIFDSNQTKKQNIMKTKLSDCCYDSEISQAQKKMLKRIANANMINSEDFQGNQWWYVNSGLGIKPVALGWVNLYEYLLKQMDLKLTKKQRGILY